MTGRWWSQPFAPEGSTYARSIARQMEGNGLDPLTVLARETAQNTWDARRDDGAPEFRISLQRLGERSRTWREMLLPAPYLGRDAVGLDQELGPETTLLLISDRGTSGLGGPLRADRRPAPGERPNFVQFVRNSGAPRDDPGSGGTYGFGKGILYAISRVSTIMIDTNTAQADPARRRLVGCCVGEDRFAPDDRGLTGRHWWGEIVDGVPDPLLDLTASDCADRLGLPGFADGRTGTDIVVLAADLDMGRGPDQLRSRHDAAEFLASSLLWHLWPKMVPDASGRAMRFTVDVDGEDVTLPDPRSTELAPFVRALSRVRDGTATPYRRTVAPRIAGSFALEIDPVVRTDTARGDAVVAAARPFEGQSHHVVRMRSPELVVDYLETAPHPNPTFRYGAVFRASEDADVHFAEAEPVTHSAWNEKKLHGTTLGVVRYARQFVHRQVEGALAPRAQAATTDTTGLGRLSVRLGSLLAFAPVDPDPPESAADRDEPGGPDTPRVGEPVTGASTTATDGASTAGRKPPRCGRAGATARIVDGPRLIVDSDGALLVVARVTVPASDQERALTADAHVIVDGVPERQPPIDAPAPQVLGWSPVQDPTTPPRTPLARGSSVRITAGDDVDWWVVASAVPDAVVSLRVRAAQGRHHVP